MKFKLLEDLNPIWMCFLEVCYPLPLCLKLVRTTFSTKAFLILLMSAFSCKKSAFFRKNSTFTQSKSVRAV